jgi:TPR repeat protein
VALGDFDLPPDDKAKPWRRGEMATHAGRLRELCRGSAPQALLWPIVGDLLEGLACLHRAGLAVGPFTAESVVFQKGRHGRGVVAKWAGYGLLQLGDPVAAEQATLRGDVRSAATLIRVLLCGDGGLLPTAAWSEWESFLSRGVATDAGFADGVEMYHAFLALLAAKELERAPRQQEPDAAAEKEAAAQAAAKPRAHERRKRVGARRSHHGSSAEGAGATVQLSPAFRVFVILVVLCLIGYGAYWFISRGDRLRKEGFVGPSVRQGAAGKGEQAVAQVADYWQLDRAGLEEHAKNGEATATMRLALLVAMGDHAHPADVKRGAELARGAAELLQKRVENEQADGDTLYWLGYAQLTGLGVARDDELGRGTLERAMRIHNHPRAMALLADYLAFGRGEGTAEDDRTALELWQKATDAQPALTPFGSECIDKVVAFVLAGRGLPRGDAPAVVKWMERVARLRHAGAMLGMGLLSLEGRLMPLDEPRAMNWFRSAAMTGNAEGMRRMGWMFERGVGTPQSDKSAAIWYRRAALGGDAEAMEGLAALMAAGRGDEVSDEAKESELRQEAAKARADALARAARRKSWWVPDEEASTSAAGVASRAEKASAASAPAGDAVAPGPVGTAPASPAEKTVPPVDPTLIRPGEGDLVPME